MTTPRTCAELGICQDRIMTCPPGTGCARRADCQDHHCPGRPTPAARLHTQPGGRQVDMPRPQPDALEFRPGFWYAGPADADDAGRPTAKHPGTIDTIAPPGRMRWVLAGLIAGAIISMGALIAGLISSHPGGPGAVAELIAKAWAAGGGR